MACGMSTADLDALLLAALREDAPWGDRTTDSLGITGEGRGVFLAKEPLVVCGLPAALRVFSLTDPTCQCEAMVPGSATREKPRPS